MTHYLSRIKKYIKIYKLTIIYTILFQWRDIEEGRIMDSKLKCSFEMPTVDQLLESKNIHDDSTVSILIDLC